MVYFGSLSEISVHGHLAIGRWDVEGTEWQDEATLLVAARKRERAVEGSGDKLYPSKAWPQVANFLKYSPIS